MDMPRDQFLLTGSTWLAIMKIRDNEDIDIIATSALKSQFDLYVKNAEIKGFNDIKKYVDISKKHAIKITKISKSKTVEELISKHYVCIDGYRFVKFRLFEKYKKPRNRPKDKWDKKHISKFFNKNKQMEPEYSGLFL